MSDPPVTLYHLVVRNDKSGEDTYMTSNPVTHQEACTMKSKMIPDTRRPKHLRTMLIEATASHDFLASDSTVETP